MSNVRNLFYCTPVIVRGERIRDLTQIQVRNLSRVATRSHRRYESSRVICDRTVIPATGPERGDVLAITSTEAGT